MASKQKEGLHLNLKLLVKTSGIVFLSLVLSKIIGYLYRVIIARYFGPEVYGLFSIALMISGWFIAVAALGLSEGLARFIPIYRAKGKSNKVTYIFNLSLIILTFSSILSGILLFFLSEPLALNVFNNSQLIFYFKVASFIIPATMLTSPFIGALRAYEKISIHSFIANIINPLSKFIIIVLLIFMGVKGGSTILSYLFGMIVVLMVSYFVSKRKIPELFIKSDLNKKEKVKTRKLFFSYSFPLLFSGVILILLYWVDTFAIGFYKSVVEVGIYQAAVPIALLLAIAPELFMQLFFPLISREYSKKRTKVIIETSKQVTKWIFLINITAFSLIILFPGAIINIIFGPAYLAAANALRILAIGAFISAVFIVPTQLIYIIGKSKLVLFNITLAFIMNVILNAILVPMPYVLFIENSLGINGAALATLISIIFLNLLFLAQSKYYLKHIFVRRKMINIFLAGIIASAFLVYLRSLFTINLFSLILLFILFLISYGLLVILFKGLDKNDFMILDAINSKLAKKRQSMAKV
ncbi:flippase [Nanoarchaeota archaeon]